MLHRMLRAASGASSIVFAPVGIIVPYISADIPSGWSRFSDADNRMIVGAGESLILNSTGGDLSQDVEFNMGSAGSHTGSNSVTLGKDGSGTFRGSPPGGTSDSGGSHSHSTFYESFNLPLPEYRDFVFIKNTSGEIPFPPGSILFGTDVVEGLVHAEIASAGRLVRASSEYGVNGGSNQFSLSATGSTSSNGSHTHGSESTRTLNAGTSRRVAHSSGGDHSHSWSINSEPFNWNLRRVVVSAWSNIFDEFGCVPNGIGMWEGSVAPEGWVILNGEGGTEDFRDRFIEIGDEESHGLVFGSNSMSAYVTKNVGSASASHSHSPTGTSYSTESTRSVPHGSMSNSHSHSVASETLEITKLPPWYALNFIKYVG